MRRLIYNLLVWAALPIFAPFSLANGKIRRNFSERIFPRRAGDGLKGAIWIHAASVGEAVVAENLMAFLRARAAGPFVVTTNTYYTRDMLRRTLGGSAQVFSLPFDLPFSIRRFMGAAGFAALVLVETELWPNLIWGASRRNIPVIIVNGRISDRAFPRYRRLAFFFKGLFDSVDLVIAQSEAHAERFIALGMDPSKVVAAGNLKYYRDPGRLPAARAERDVVTFGSVREKELPVLVPVIEALRRDFPGVRVFVAPRELTLIAAIERQLPEGIPVTRYSAMKGGRREAAGGIVLVDTVGDLIDIYAASLVAFVGGSLAPYGGQNILEPLFVGAPVIFGPHVENFSEIARVILAGGAGFMVHDGGELLSKIRLVVEDPDVRKELAGAGRGVLEAQRGVMERAASLVLETIWKRSTSS
jgi:3-deoxy-D-manno-octulosonic-acid transferase